MAKEGRLSSWFVQKLILGVVLTGLGFVGVGLALFLLDDGGFDQVHRAKIRAITDETARLKQVIVHCDAILAEHRTQLAAQQLRAGQAEKVAAELESMNGTFNRLTTDSAQVKENDARLVRMKEMAEGALRRSKEIEQQSVRTQWEKDGAELALQRNREQKETVIKDDAVLMHYVRGAWEYVNWVMGFALVLVVLPPLLRSK